MRIASPHAADWAIAVLEVSVDTPCPDPGQRSVLGCAGDREELDSTTDVSVYVNVSRWKRVGAGTLDSCATTLNRRKRNEMCGAKRMAL